MVGGDREGRVGSEGGREGRREEVDLCVCVSRRRKERREGGREGGREGQ